MKGRNKIRQITLEEARRINPSEVAYMTFKNGNVVIVNRELNQNKEIKNISIQEGQEQEDYYENGEDSKNSVPLQNQKNFIQEQYMFGNFEKKRVNENGQYNETNEDYCKCCGASRNLQNENTQGIMARKQQKKYICRHYYQNEIIQQNKQPIIINQQRQVIEYQPENMPQHKYQSVCNHQSRDEKIEREDLERKDINYSLSQGPYRQMIYKNKQRVEEIEREDLETKEISSIPEQQYQKVICNHCSSLEHKKRKKNEAGISKPLHVRQYQRDICSHYSRIEQPEREKLKTREFDSLSEKQYQEIICNYCLGTDKKEREEIETVENKLLPVSQYQTMVCNDCSRKKQGEREIFDNGKTKYICPYHSNIDFTKRPTLRRQKQVINYISEPRSFQYQYQQHQFIQQKNEDYQDEAYEEENTCPYYERLPIFPETQVINQHPKMIKAQQKEIIQSECPIYHQYSQSQEKENEFIILNQGLKFSVEKPELQIQRAGRLCQPGITSKDSQSTDACEREYQVNSIQEVEPQEQVQYKRENFIILRTEPNIPNYRQVFYGCEHSKGNYEVQNSLRIKQQQVRLERINRINSFDTYNRYEEEKSTQKNQRKIRRNYKMSTYVQPRYYINEEVSNISSNIKAPQLSKIIENGFEDDNGICCEYCSKKNGDNLNESFRVKDDFYAYETKNIGSYRKSGLCSNFRTYQTSGEYE